LHYFDSKFIYVYRLQLVKTVILRYYVVSRPDWWQQLPLDHFK